MTLVQLQVFLAIVEKGSFTQAAETIGMTQSAVSHALSSLEAELGVSLLKRDRTGTYLSEIGREILQHAREMMAQAENIRQKTAAARGLTKGRIRIGTFPSTSIGLLPGIIREFQQRYPGIELVLFEGTDYEVYDWIQNRLVDIGFVALPVEGVETVPIAQDELLVVMSAKYHLSSAKSLTIAQIAQEPFIMPKASRDTVIQELFQEAGITFHPRYEALGNATILALVEEGLGITLLPQLVLATNHKEIAAVPLEPPTWRRLAFGMLSFAELTPAARSFVEQAQDWSRAAGYFFS